MAHGSPWQQARLLRQAVSVWPDRLPRHAWALGILALALLLGVTAADDYSAGPDTDDQIEIGEATLRHLAGESGLNLLSTPHNRLYGPVFEVPLRLVQRIFHTDEGHGLVARHLLTHLLFLASGFAGYLLAWRMFGSRWLALFALLLFLLHPRIYAHSFFNSKDVPFLAMFMICLWLAHRAFRPQSPAHSSSTAAGTVGAAVYGANAVYGAFALCGVAAGLLTTLRISGLVFVAVVVLMRFCDIVLAGGWRERQRAIASCALFAFASVATYYATMPYLWADPLERVGEIVTVMLAHPTDISALFQGEIMRRSELPPSYLPVWFGITTPPLALALGAVGLGALVWRCGAVGTSASGERHARPLAVRIAALLRNAPLRFELLVGACLALPVLAVVVLQPALYDGWRHFYFLWAPFVLLAASGLLTLAQGASVACRRFLPLEAPVATVAGLAALGLGAIAVEVIRMHPDQDNYFNVLATGPHNARPVHQRYFHVSANSIRSMIYILEELAPREQPDAVFNVNFREAQWPDPLDITPDNRKFGFLSQRDRRRFKLDPNADMDFFISRGPRIRTPGWAASQTAAPYVNDLGGLTPLVTPPVLYERQIYGRVIMQVATPDLSRVDTATARAFRALYRDVTAGVPALGGETDVYRSETAVTWVKESCPAGGVNRRLGMTVFPLDAARAPQWFRAYGVRIGDACLWRVPLPEYAIAKILLLGIGTLASDAHLEERRRRHAAITAGSPAARSTFDLYLEDGTLTYIKNPCVEADTEAPFFLHVVPVHLSDLPISRRRAGMEALDFRFGASKPSWRTVAGDIFDGICMATLTLPHYPIANIATGQYMPDGDLWRVDIGGG